MPKRKRFCLLCQHDLNENLVEDEAHFLIDCPSYSEARRILRERLQSTTELEFDLLNRKDKLKLFLVFPHKLWCVMAFIRRAWRIRTAKLADINASPLIEHHDELD